MLPIEEQPELLEDLGKDIQRVIPTWDELARLFVLALGGWGLMIAAIWTIVQIV